MRKILYTTVILLLCGTFQLQAQDFDRLRSLRGYWKFSIGDHKEWATTEYDDADWEEIYVPRRWEREGFNGYDGYAWYRLNVKGKDLEGEKSIYLKLGYIDDVDEVFVNGKKIGFTGGFPPEYKTAWRAERLYRIPDNLLNYDGDNLIAVRIYDHGGEGGIYSGDVGLYVPDKDYKGSVLLDGTWKIKIADKPAFAEPDYDDENWEDIAVPSNWKSIGIHDLNDFAWYRKKFYVGPDDGIKDMTIICGKIDDFDEVFINGVKVGATNDGRRLGRSQSYSELRVYEIPADVLKRGENTIAVRVEDIGDNGGIYEGPVMIVPNRYARKYLRNDYFWRW